MLALASASQGQNSTLIVVIIAAVAVAAFWRTILKVGIAAVIIGFIFLLIAGLLEVLQGLRGLIP
jgi:Na+-transporting NADH:ubiquinone oxidoreductase subunit NqrB